MKAANMLIHHIAMRLATLLLLAAAAMSVGTTHAATALALKICGAGGACGEAHVVDDSEMAEVAGKFTIAGQIVGMNLLMTSSWQAPNGQKLDGMAAVALRLPGDGSTGRLSTQASATGSDPTTQAPASATSNTVTGGKGLDNVNGVSQAVQVAGNSNAAKNSAAVQVTTGALSDYAGNGTTTAAYRGANGAQATVDMSNNSVMLQLQTPDGMARQSVNDANSGNIHQNIQIAANRQAVVNQLQLEVQVRPLTAMGLANQGLLQSVNALRGR